MLKSILSLDLDISDRNLDISWADIEEDLLFGRHDAPPITPEVEWDSVNPDPYAN